MPDPTSVRYFEVPGVVFLWALTLICIGLFAFRVAHLVKILKRGRPEKRWDHWPHRVQHVLQHVFAQRRLLQEPFLGVPHLFIFWAFVFFATSFAWNLLRGLFPVLPVPYADEVGWLAMVMEVLASCAFVGLFVAALRRYVFTPPGLERTADASLVLGLIGLVLLTFLVGQGMTSVAEPHAAIGSAIASTLGSALARLGVDANNAPNGYLAMWWLHMVIVLGFLAYLPYSKHMHLLAAPFAVFSASMRPGALSASPPADVASLEAFTWRQLYSALSCAECGRCDRVCPATASGYPLSPKTLVHSLREAVLANHGVVRGNGRHVSALQVDHAASGNGGRIVGDLVKPEEIWSCTTCLACMHRCPVFNEHVPLIVEMRRQLVSEGLIESGIQDVLESVSRYGNSFGKSPRARARWTRELDFKIKDARQEPVEYLWIVGDTASFDPRVHPITRATARIFHEAQLDFGILYEGEHCIGTDVRRIGEEGLFEMLREHSLEALEGALFNNIVTTDPHSYESLKNDYVELFQNKGAHVLHSTELFEQLLRLSRLTVREPLDLHATYHDPCYLGRYNDVYDAPRRVLNTIGVRITEMPRNRERAECCGAGGGRLWMEDTPGVTERPANRRVREAAALRDVATLAISCPKDLIMFQDALKATGLESQLDVRDVAELVLASLGLSERSDSYAEPQAQR